MDPVDFYTSEDPQQRLQTTAIHKVFMLILQNKKGENVTCVGMIL